MKEWNVEKTEKEMVLNKIIENLDWVENDMNNTINEVKKRRKEFKEHSDKIFSDS